MGHFHHPFPSSEIVILKNLADFTGGGAQHPSLGTAGVKRAALRGENHEAGCSVKTMVGCLIWELIMGDTVDGRNPANQLGLVVYPIIYIIRKMVVPLGWYLAV